jgi:hypothetical protein
MKKVLVTLGAAVLFTAGGALAAQRVGGAGPAVSFHGEKSQSLAHENNSQRHEVRSESKDSRGSDLDHASEVASHQLRHN